MQFLAPAALLALLPLAGIIILLYLLRLRRREMIIPSVFLWRRAVEDVQANAPFQKLRRNLLLFLQLAALSALVFGLAGPHFLGHRLAGKSTVVVLDASASMRATDAGASRFEEAKRRAAYIVKGMGRRDETAVVMCAARAWVATPFSREQRRLLGTIQSAQPTDGTTNMRDGLLLALSLARKRQNARVYVISDGAFPPLPQVELSAEVEFLRVGTRNDNVALLAFEAARSPGDREHQLFVRLNNYAGESKRCVLSLYHEDDLLDAQEIELQAGENRVETYKMTLREAGLLHAELEADDDLAVDNVAYTSAEPPSAISVLLVTPENLFLEQALLVLPEVEVYKTSSLSEANAREAYRKYDVVVFDRVTPPEAPASGAVMLIATEAWGGPASLGTALSSPAITHWETQDPILRYVNLGAVQISKGHALRPAADAKVLAGAGDHPVIVAQEKPGMRALAFGWDFLDSDLPLRVGFPVLLSNAIRWLAGAGGGAKLMTVRPGTMLQFAAPPEADHAQVVFPDGRRRALAVTDRGIAFTEADWVGVYSLAAGDSQWRFAVDLRSAEESDLTPHDELQLGERKVVAEAGVPKVRQHLWPYLALLALAVLLAEWHLYHRRY